MKKILPLLLILVSGYATVLYGQGDSRYIVAPVENEKVFFEGDQIFTYQAKDDVFVSIGFISYRNGECIFDMTVDNQSEDTLEFDPRQIHLFRFNQDTLAENKTYYPLDPELVLDSIDITIDKKKDKIKNNTFFSIFLGALYVTTEIVGCNGAIDYDALKVIRFAHDLAQMGLDISRDDTGEKIYDLEYAGDYWLNGTLQQHLVLPHAFESGKIHFKVPQSEFFQIYVPIDYRIYSYRFQDVACNNMNH